MMDALITAMIAVMPLLATAPLAIGAVAIVALLASPRLRDALGDWARRRLGGEDGSAQRTIEQLRAEVHRLEQRVEFLERMLVQPPREAARAPLAAAAAATPRQS